MRVEPQDETFCHHLPVTFLSHTPDKPRPRGPGPSLVEEQDSPLHL